MGMRIPPSFGGSKKRSFRYPKNWRHISREFRIKHGYKCAICGVCCGNHGTHKALLDVHHKNGVRGDCEESNLQCLCKFHHSKQHYHNHYKPKIHNLELLSKLWDEQKIPMEKRR